MQQMEVTRAEGRPPWLVQLGWGALAAGVVGTALMVLGAIAAPARFFQSYLVAYTFCTGIALGCLALLMLHHLTGGVWGWPVRRLAEAAAGTLPLLAVLFVPLAFGLRDLYPWARPDVVAQDPLLQHKQPYLNPPFFLLRAGAYLAAWIVLGELLRRWSQAQEGQDPRWTPRVKRLSSGGMLLLALTATFAIVDWQMSLEPSWYSTIYPAMVGVGYVVSAFAFVMLLLAFFHYRSPELPGISWRQRRDLGGLLFAFVILWAYLAFSQFLLIWSGNLPQEVSWYLRRSAGGWEKVMMAVIAFDFVLPLLLLLSAKARESWTMLLVVAAAVVAVRYVDTFWLVRPPFGPGGLEVYWLDPAALAGVGGLWLAFYVWRLGGRPLIPLLGAPAGPQEERHDPVW